MFQRNISTNEVEYVLKRGEIIIDYPNDKPFPSKLLFCFYNERPLHIVCSINEETKTTIIITAYIPTLELWENDFKTRK
jgi:hypothetical protein